MARTGWYLLFLIAAVLYLVLGYISQTRQQAVLASRKSGAFVLNQGTILTSLIPIILIPWILSGFFSTRFLFFIVVGFEASAVLTIVSYYIFGLTPTDVNKRFAFWGGEFGLKHRLIAGSVLVLLVAGLIAYFCLATYFYFANPLRSQNAVQRILTLNLALCVANALFLLLVNSAQLASPRNDDRTRRGVFMAQATNALQTGLLLTIYLGLIGVGSERFLPASLVVPPTYAKYIPLAVLTLLYLLILVIPYFAGLENRRRSEISHYTLVLGWLSRIIDVVGIPDKHDVDQLKKVRSDFISETDQWIQAELIVKELAVKIEHDPNASESLPDELKSLVVPYHTLKDEDLRFVRLRWSDDLKATLDEIIGQYEQYASQPDPVQKFITLAGPIAEHFRDQRARFDARLKEADEKKNLTPVLARLIPTMGAVPVVWQYGHKLIEILPFKH